MCAKVVVFYEQEAYEFPVYDWVDENEISLLSGQGEEQLLVFQCLFPPSLSIQFVLHRCTVACDCICLKL